MSPFHNLRPSRSIEIDHWSPLHFFEPLEAAGSSSVRIHSSLVYDSSQMSPVHSLRPSKSIEIIRWSPLRSFEPLEAGQVPPQSLSTRVKIHSSYEFSRWVRSTHQTFLRIHLRLAKFLFIGFSQSPPESLH